MMSSYLPSRISRLVKQSLSSAENRRKPGGRRVVLARRRLLRLERLENRQVLACSIVDTTADVVVADEFTSLREAIEIANTGGCAGPDVIEFDISQDDPGFDSSTGVWTIYLRDALPNIVSPVVIDGHSQPYSANHFQESYPRIQLNGFAAGPASNGLSLVSGSDSSSITGLTINGFANAGIYVTSRSNRIEDNYIGTNYDGTQPVGNLNGIEIYNDIFGGGDFNVVNRNLISGNGVIGQAVQVVVEGTDQPWIWDDLGFNSSYQYGVRDGTAPTVVDLSDLGVSVGNFVVVAYNSGFTNAFAGEPDADGVGHTFYLANDLPGTSGEVFPSNYIDASFYDVFLNALVGTFADSFGRIVGQPFVVNNGPTQLFVPPGATHLQLGVNDDIFALNTGELNVTVANSFGGAVHGGGLNGITDGNGIFIHGDFAGGANSNSITNNLIGTDPSEVLAVPNTHDGVAIFDLAFDNTVGGPHHSSSPKRNVIAGNSAHGVDIAFGASRNVVQGNYIGVNSSGSFDIPNGASGVLINFGASFNLVGSNGNEVIDGQEFEEGNVISANRFAGVNINESATHHNTVAGNIIGLNSTGEFGFGNFRGVEISDGAHDNLIGGVTESERNIISGNTSVGIYVVGRASGNSIRGNYIGTDISGTDNVGNGGSGVEVRASDRNTIADNLISGNGGAGVQIHDLDSFLSGSDSSDAFDNVISGNTVGATVDGNTALGNEFGVSISWASATLVEGNQLSGNRRNGVALDGDLALGNPGGATGRSTVRNNKIGTNKGGAAAVPNGSYGVAIAATSENSVIGNLISGNELSGVLLLGSNSFDTADNTIDSNTIGLGATGLALPNGANGVEIVDARSNDVTRNVISGNAAHGVNVRGALAIANTIAGNKIGTKADASPLGNAGAGVQFSGGASHNTVGGANPLSSNIIANNGAAGVAVGLNAADSSIGNAIVRNSIFANFGLGIDLASDGPTTNDLGDADVGPNRRQNKPVIGSVTSSAAGTTIIGALNSHPNSTFTLEFFDNPPGADEGQTFIGSMSVTTNASGDATFSINLTATGNLAGHNLTATATDATISPFHTADTSEFSASVLAIENVTSKVAITRSGFTFNRAGNFFSQTVTIRNITGGDIEGPMYLVLDGLTPAGGFLGTNGAPPPATGMTAGGVRYVVLPLGAANKLSAGASVSVSLKFTTNLVNFVAKVLAGLGPV